MITEKIIFDTNIYDAIAQDDEFANLLDDAQRKGLVKVIVTHIQLDQINQIPDALSKEKLLRITGSNGTIETAGSFPDLSREGWANRGFDNQVARFLTKKDYNNKNKADALIASTALEVASIFVTDDKSLLNRYPHRKMNSSSFKNYLGQITQL